MFHGLLVGVLCGGGFRPMGVRVYMHSVNLSKDFFYFVLYSSQFLASPRFGLNRRPLTRNDASEGVHLASRIN